jgi:hypothetical protein
MAEPAFVSPVFIPGVTVTERILANVRSTIEGMTTDRGFPFTWRTILDQQFNAWFQTMLPAVGISFVDDDHLTHGNIGRETRGLRCQIDFWLRERGPKGSLKMELEQAIWAVYQAMKYDGHRGGWAKDTRLGRVIRAEPEDTRREAGASVYFQIDYRFLEGRPMDDA